MTRKYPERIALFPGSFNPFTIGHENIALRALKFADKVVIGVGFNVSKPGSSDEVKQRAAYIRELFAKEERIEVIAFSDLVTQCATRIGASFIIKGVRSVADYENEFIQADVNRRLTGIETLLLPADPSLSSISSSLVRELRSFGADVSRFLP